MGEIVKGTLEVPLRAKGFSVGVDVKDSKVLKIYPSSVFLGYLYTNDVLVTVNQKKVVNTADFFKIVQENSPGKILIEYERNEECHAIIKTTPIVGRPGFEQIDIELTFKNGGSPLGLLVHRDSTGRVIVAMVESGSAASKAVLAGDVLTRVNNTTINDRDIARKLIIDSINNDKKVKLILERPTREGADNRSKMGDDKSTKSLSCPSTAKTAKSEVSGTLPAVIETKQNTSLYTPTIRPNSTYVPPAPLVAPSTYKKDPNCDPTLPQDVLDIMAANREFYKAMPTEPGILLKTRKMDGAPHVDTNGLGDKAPETEIAFDPSPKPLKVTPKRVGS